MSPTSFSKWFLLLLPVVYQRKQYILKDFTSVSYGSVLHDPYSGGGEYKKYSEVF